MKKEMIIISLGGSLICPRSGSPDVAFFKKFKKFILKQVKGGKKFVIVSGGGELARKYQQAAAALEAGPKNLDWVGIAATKINAELLRASFGPLAYKKVLANPQGKIITDKKIIVAAGWLPGSSSDKDAVLWAKNFKADLVINLSNIDYLYDKDPNKFKNVEKIKKISWRDFRLIVGDKWNPGKHTPFDPIASRLAHHYNIKVAILNGDDLVNLEKFLSGKNYQGTLIF